MIILTCIVKINTPKIGKILKVAIKRVSFEIDVSRSIRIGFEQTWSQKSNSKFLNSGRSCCKEGNESLYRPGHLLGMTTRMQDTTRPTSLSNALSTFSFPGYTRQSNKQ